MFFENLKLAEKQRQWENSLRGSHNSPSAFHEPSKCPSHLSMLLKNADISSALPIPLPSFPENAFSLRIDLESAKEEGINILDNPRSNDKVDPECNDNEASPLEMSVALEAGRCVSVERKKMEGEVERFRFHADEIYMGETTEEEAFVGSLQPAIVSATRGSAATVVFCSHDHGVTQFSKSEESMVCIAARALFNAVQILDQKEDMFLTVSWVCLQGDQAVDVLHSAVAATEYGTVETATLAEADEVPWCRLTNVMEVKMKTYEEVEQLMNRVHEVNEHTPLSTADVGHSVLTFTLNDLDEEAGGGKVGSVRFISIDIKRSEPLAEVIRAIESQQPTIPFHKSKLTLLLRDALTGKQRLAVMGTLSGRSSQRGKAHLEDAKASMVVLTLIHRLMRLFATPEEDSPEEDLSQLSCELDMEEVSKILSAYCDGLSAHRITQMSTLVRELSAQGSEVSQIMMLLFGAITREAQISQTLKDEAEISAFKLRKVTEENYSLQEKIVSLNKELNQTKALEIESARSKKVTREDFMHEPFVNETRNDPADIKLRKALEEIADYEMYRDVMETTIIRMKAEFERITAQNKSFNETLPKLKQRAQREVNARKLLQAKLNKVKEIAEESKQASQKLKRELDSERESRKGTQRKLKLKHAELQRQGVQLTKLEEEVQELKARNEVIRSASATRIATLEEQLRVPREMKTKKASHPESGHREENESKAYEPGSREDTLLLGQEQVGIEIEEKNEQSFTSGLVQGLKMKRKNNRRSRGRSGGVAVSLAQSKQKNRLQYIPSQSEKLSRS